MARPNHEPRRALLHIIEYLYHLREARFHCASLAKSGYVDANRCDRILSFLRYLVQLGEEDYQNINETNGLNYPPIKHEAWEQLEELTIPPEYELRPRSKKAAKPAKDKINFGKSILDESTPY